MIHGGKSVEAGAVQRVDGVHKRIQLGLYRIQLDTMGEDRRAKQKPPQTQTRVSSFRPFSPTRTHPIFRLGEPRCEIIQL